MLINTPLLSEMKILIKFLINAIEKALGLLLTKFLNYFKFFKYIYLQRAKTSFWVPADGKGLSIILNIVYGFNLQDNI